MKAILLVLPLLGFLSTSALANDQIKKLQTIKSMYSEILNPYDFRYDETPNIYKYSDRDYQNIIALAVADMPEGNPDGDMTYCDDERSTHLTLIPIEDYDLVDVHYRSLRNGNIRAVMEYSDHPASDIYVDFSLDCQSYGNTCKITDMINHRGSSARVAIEKECR